MPHCFPGPEDEEEESNEVERKIDQSEDEKNMETDHSDSLSETDQEKEPIEMEETNSPAAKEEVTSPVEVEEETSSDIEAEEPIVKQEVESDSLVTAEMSPQRQEVMKKLNFPSDLLSLKKVKESEFLQTGIPWSISSHIPLSKGTSIGPYQGEMVALSSIKPGQLVLQVNFDCLSLCLSYNS